MVDSWGHGKKVPQENRKSIIGRKHENYRKHETKMTM